MKAGGFLGRLEERVRLQPDAAALECGGRILSYADLLLESRKAAALLAGRGAVPGSLVAIYMKKSPEYVIAMLGSWMCGAAFLPLDTSQPAERMDAILSDSPARLILCDGEPPSGLPGAELLQIGERREHAPLSALPDPDPERLAYMIYTSGSAGAPKGVLVPHRGIVGLLEAQILAFRMQAGSRSLWLLSSAFDASISDIGTALLSGATLVIETGATLDTAACLPRVIAERAITHVDMPPALLALLERVSLPGCLQTIVIGGEACQPEAAAYWGSRLRVVNVYGPTEATVCSSLCVCDASWSRPLIGDPLPGVTLHVLDGAQVEVRVGSSGELYIGGDGVAIGYWNRPELTEERFVVVNGMRLYRTGDHVRRLTDGKLEFLGRLDRQIKLQGRLIEPAEIERVIGSDGRVLGAAVLKAHAALVGFVACAASDRAALAETLPRRLREALPAWMVPARMKLIDAIPFTANGKTDFAALARLAAEQAHGEVLSAAAGSREAALLEIFAQVLSPVMPGPEDDFFESGGSSYAALEAVVHAARRGIAFSPAQLYRHRTARRLAMALDDAGARGAGMPSSILAGYARLPDSTQALIRNALPGDPADGAIFVTGATGFLGSALLCEILRETESTVICLVRGHGGMQRLLSGVARVSGAREPGWHDRIRALPGDLSLPRFGLTDTAWSELCDRTSAIFHLGAGVNLCQPLAALSDVNVGGTAQALALSLTGRTKPLHYASTLSVFSATDSELREVREDSPLDGRLSVFGGYAQSKWIAEKLLRNALAAGASNIRVYRLGLLTAHSKTGAVPENDLFTLFNRAVCKLEAFPRNLDPGLTFDMTPVDFAARAMLHIALRKASSNRPLFYHIANPKPFALGSLLDFYRRAGLDLRAIDVDEWNDALRTLHSAPGAPNAAVALVGMSRGGGATCRADLRAFDIFEASGRSFDLANSVDALRGSGISCPLGDDGMFRPYLSKD